MRIRAHDAPSFSYSTENTGEDPVPAVAGCGPCHRLNPRKARLCPVGSWFGAKSGPETASSVMARRPSALPPGHAEFNLSGLVHYCRAMPALPPRSTNFCTLPVAVFGSWSTKLIQCGVLKWARLLRT